MKYPSRHPYNATYNTVLCPMYLCPSRSNNIPSDPLNCGTSTRRTDYGSATPRDPDVNAVNRSRRSSIREILARTDVWCIHTAAIAINVYTIKNVSSPGSMCPATD